ncbi:serine carboxypeptidase [Flagelloscypha sp. PMI_526]|nr:serine carboxypeptidase [Flagelloscypha sp. PMI_526]
MSFKAVWKSRLVGLGLVALSLVSAAKQTTFSFSRENYSIQLPPYTQQLGPNSLSRLEPCFPGSLEYSGFLNTSDGRHLHFRFFESRKQPESSPLVLWMNGGPGSSSAHGYMYEAGPCNIIGPNTPVYNPHSWTEVANVIFLDQPAGVGYSYTDDGIETVGTSRSAAQDSYRLLQTFFNAFPKYAGLPFHIMGESYGGHYAPHLASNIHVHNKEAGDKHINLASVIFINAFLDPLIQVESSIQFVCDPVRRIIDPTGPECRHLKATISEGNEKFKACYADPSKCVEAGIYITDEWEKTLGSFSHNRFDYSKPCNDSQACYKQGIWTEEYLNLPFIKARLGVNPDLAFSLLNETVNKAFIESGDYGTRTTNLLPELIEDGIRVLFMNGDHDTLCEHTGSEKMVQSIESVFQEAFNRTPLRPWFTGNGTIAGTVRSAGEPSTAGNVTFVRVYDAGHMVPFDQPLAALDLLTRWISNTPI